jgi:tetratricopeptide (TPR) repeat protein
LVSGKPSAAIDSLGTSDDSAFARALRATALMLTSTDAAFDEMEKLVDGLPVRRLRIERGIRRLAKGRSEGALSDLKGSAEFGFALWHAQDFDGAARELAARSERSALVDETLGYVLQAKGEQEAGGARLVASLEKEPTRENFFRLARHIRGDRQWKALQEIGQVLAKAVPAEPEAWAAQAEAAFWLKSYDASIASVTAALEKKVDPKKLLKWRGYSYEELGKTTEAHEDWSRLAELDSDNGEALAHRAWMRAKLARWADVRQDAERGISRTSNAWAAALGRFAMAADELHGPAPEGETIDAEARQEGAMKQLLLAARTGAVEESDLSKVRPMFASVAEEEWKKVVEAAAEKQKELKDDAKRASMLGIMADHGGGSVMVTGTYRKSGARQAGLAPGDIILEVDGRRVIHVGDVGSILSGREPGTKVKVKLERELRPKLKMVQVREITLTNRDIFGEEP